MHKIKYFTVLVIAVLAMFQSSVGQGLNPAPGLVFDDESLPLIYIYINPDSLEALYDNPFGDEHYRAQFVFARGSYRDSVGNIGFRCRGNFSRAAAKKNFKVSFNTFKPGRKWNGLEKLNLNVQANDPSVIRAKLASDLIPQMGVEGTRANHCNIYINGDYYGLYINVEHIDEQFAEAHYGSNQGNLYKCTYPVDLVWQGSNPDAYSYCEWAYGGDRPAYTDLVDFIDALNNTPDADLGCELEQILNVDDYLRQAAIDVMIGNWDGYIYNKNNLFLFHNPVSDRFEYIIYDTDNTYGIDWVDRDWGTRDIYTWSKGGEGRPLYERLMDNPEYRARFSWYIDRLTNQIMEESVYFPRIDEIKALITPFAIADPYRPLDQGFSVDDFNDSYDVALGGHVDYGLKPFVSTRRSFSTAQLESYQVAPVINHIRHNYPVLDQVPGVTVFVDDDAIAPQVWLVYLLNGAQDSTLMLDDGLHGDGLANDGFFGALLAPQEDEASWSFRIHVYGSDGQSSRRPCNPVTWTIGSPAIPLYINEFMAQNVGYISDEEGEFGDWLEIYNGGTEPIYLGDKYLSDQPQYPARWRMPEMILSAGEFAWFWADDDEQDGPNHTSFRLNAEGGHIGIYASETDRHYPIHTISYGVQSPDVSVGLIPDGAGEVQILSTPTPGWSNVLTGLNPLTQGQVQLYPNPAHDKIYLGHSSCTEWVIQGMDGRIWKSFSQTADSWYDLIGIPSGIYLLNGRCGLYAQSLKLVVQ